ncbi:MAG TPA: proton-conducting transporter membrane subunit, partial [Thermoguttaceae bacterium]|nr:proton-conducting transporter membrane subunit [Thermoguttaceae bacterium]
AMLFLAAGNILALYHTKSTTRVRGLLRTLPITGVLWLVGFLAVVGSPPFGPFLSELTILKGVLDEGRPVVAVIYLLALAIAFVGMATIFLRMAYGPPPGAIAAAGGDSAIRAGTKSAARREPLWSIAPVAALGLAVLVLGVYVPPRLVDLLHQAAEVLGAK